MKAEISEKFPTAAVNAFFLSFFFPYNAKNQNSGLPSHWRAVVSYWERALSTGLLLKRSKPVQE